MAQKTLVLRAIRLNVAHPQTRRTCHLGLILLLATFCWRTRAQWIWAGKKWAVGGSGGWSLDGRPEDEMALGLVSLSDWGHRGLGVRGG